MSYVSEIVDTVSESTAASASASQRGWFIATSAIFLASVVIVKSMSAKLPSTAFEILEKEISAIDDVLRKGIGQYS